MPAQLDEDTPKLLDVLANDYDPDGGAVSLVAVNAISARGASVTIDPSGLVKYDPRGSAKVQALIPGQTDCDTFMYQITDGLGYAIGSVSVTVSGVNDSPIVKINASLPVYEGSTPTLDGSTSYDPDLGATLAYSWDLDGDGRFGETGAAASRGNETGMKPTVSTAGLDGPSNLPIALRVSDGRVTVTRTVLLPISNRSPAIGVNNFEGTTAIEPGSTFTASGFYFSDPGPDTWTATVDYGDGSGTQSLPLNPDKTFSLSHLYTAAALPGDGTG